MTLERAIEVFCGGFSFSRSLSHPYLVDRVKGIWVMRDAPRTSGDVRVAEFVIHGMDPLEAVSVAREVAIPRYALSVISSLDEADGLKGSYKSLGYRLIRREPMMVRETRGVAVRPCGAEVRRVTELGEADLIAKTAGRRQIRPEHLSDPDSVLRLFGAFREGEAVGWVKSIRVGEDAAWVSNLFVDPGSRRMGIGAGLMSLMLADDWGRGISTSVLLASDAGSKLYQTLGYRSIGILQLFTPRKG